MALLNKLLLFKCITDGAWGRTYQPLGDFFNFLEKISNLTLFRSHAARFWSHFKEIDC